MGFFLTDSKTTDLMNPLKLFLYCLFVHFTYFTVSAQIENHEYVIHQSTGKGEKPQIGDQVSFHFQIRAKDSIMYSSHIQGKGKEQKIIIQASNPSQQTSPVEEVLRVMHQGDSATVSLRIDTMTNIPPDFENVKYVHYDVVVKDIITKEQLKITRGKSQQKAVQIGAELKERVSKYMAGELDSLIQTTTSGLKYIIHEQGDGIKAQSGKSVSASYFGALTNGERFDDSFSRGEPIDFILGRGSVIEGWDEGILLLNEGGKATLFIPSALGYGEIGSPPVIPGGAELVYYVELEEVY